MKKYLFILLGAFVFSTTTIYAQEPVEQDAKAAKLQEKENKRKAKEEEKAKKEKEKALKSSKKAEKKDAKIAKLEKEYAEFIADYEPLETNTGYAEVDTFFVRANELFAILVDVEQSIGYIDVRTHKEVDEITEEEIQVLDGIYNKNTGEEVQKSDALKAYGAAGLQLTGAAATGATLILDGTNAVLASITDPMALLTVGGKAKKVIKHVKMSVNMIPIIQRRIKENTDAMNYKKNN